VILLIRMQSTDGGFMESKLCREILLSGKKSSSLRLRFAYISPTSARFFDTTSGIGGRYFLGRTHVCDSVL
jgi:hypothetical protein